MDKGNKISVRINGEDTYLDRKEDSEAQKEVQMAQDEQASAIEDWMEEQEKQKKKKEDSNDPEFESDSNLKDISVLERTYPVKNSRFGVSKTIKRLIMAGASAVLIGVALGYIMLRIFAGMEAPEASSSTAYQDDVTEQETVTGQESNETGSTTDNSNTDQGTNTNEGQAIAASKTAMTFPDMGAFVVQAGIFSTKGQAEVMQSAIATKGFKSYVWPRDGQFYLFAGVAPSKAEAEQIATLLKAQEVEVYVKDWSVSGTEKSVAQPEGEWVQAGVKEWQSLLSPATSLITSGTGDAGALAKPIQSWQSTIPENIAEQAAPLQQSYDQYLKAVQSYESNQTNANLWGIQVSLLGVWYGYEQYVQ